MKTSNTRAIGVLQVGRLGDLWWTVPLADYLSDAGHTVEVWFDARYGDPFKFFPSVVPRPVRIPRYLPSSSAIGSIINSALQQINVYIRLVIAGRRVIWQQIYPFHVGAFIRNRPYPEYLFRKLGSDRYRRARTSLISSCGSSILYFATSLSLRVSADTQHMEWIETNLEILASRLGFRVLYIPPPGDATEHARYETWRGELDEYQRLVAGCGLIFGISTSAHVLGQLLGKPVVACYINPTRQFDTIGRETVRLYPGEFIGEPEILRIKESLGMATP